jgi:hypothetical protein
MVDIRKTATTTTPWVELSLYPPLWRVNTGADKKTMMPVGRPPFPFVSSFPPFSSPDSRRVLAFCRSNHPAGLSCQSPNKVSALRCGRPFGSHLCARERLLKSHITLPDCLLNPGTNSAGGGRGGKQRQHRGEGCPLMDLEKGFTKVGSK